MKRRSWTYRASSRRSWKVWAISWTVCTMSTARLNQKMAMTTRITLIPEICLIIQEGNYPDYPYPGGGPGGRPGPCWPYGPGPGGPSGPGNRPVPPGGGGTGIRPGPGGGIIHPGGGRPIRPGWWWRRPIRTIRTVRLTPNLEWIVTSDREYLMLYAQNFECQFCWYHR